MGEYDPERGPDPEWWLSLDESERMNLVQGSPRNDEELPGSRLHAAIHLVVENQIAMGDKTPVAATLERLLAEGLGRHDAIHAIGSVLAKHIRQSTEYDSSAAVGVDEPSESYVRELLGLRAVKWRGQMSALMTVDYLEERAARGDRSKFERVMGKVRDVEPDKDDA